jgi:hypothetical protein
MAWITGLMLAVAVIRLWPPVADCRAPTCLGLFVLFPVSIPVLHLAHTTIERHPSFFDPIWSTELQLRIPRFDPYKHFTSLNSPELFFFVLTPSSVRSLTLTAYYVPSSNLSAERPWSLFPTSMDHSDSNT